MTSNIPHEHQHEEYHMTAASPPWPPLLYHHHQRFPSISSLPIITNTSYTRQHYSSSQILPYHCQYPVARTPFNHSGLLIRIPNIWTLTNMIPIQSGAICFTWSPNQIQDWKTHLRKNKPRPDPTCALCLSQWSHCVMNVSAAICMFSFILRRVVRFLRYDRSHHFPEQYR